MGFYSLPMNHWKVGLVMELTIGMVLNMSFVLGFRHEVGKHGDLVNKMEVVFLPLPLMVSLRDRLVLGNNSLVMLVMVLMLKRLMAIFRLSMDHWK